ncbi:GNAT family N-acetyltransferase [Telmatobacter sp. DSM 110680]|uniref:GNAT family N-acetyltransferase n=1 Tax=Telmatobacter sp. DSM 110680 TaxID=3036704 RepID=A0AAU7DQQ0_9BACT
MEATAGTSPAGCGVTAMFLEHAKEDDYPAIIELVNAAYRGTGAVESWNIETGIIEGTRLTDSLLRQDLATKPDAHFLVHRDLAGGAIVGTVWLEPVNNRAWYLGLFTIDPALQKQHLGRKLLSAAEDFARAHKAKSIRMGVLSVRSALVAWYQRRGYQLTGETEPYPYGDNRFGTPLRDDLEFVILGKQL